MTPEVATTASAGEVQATSTTSILLTGESGFLGKRVRVRLEAEPGVTVRVLTGRLGELGSGDRLGVDTAIHLAAWTRKSHEREDVAEILDANVLGLQRLLSCLDPAPRRLLFASTTDVYGNNGGERIGEDALLDPASEYAASKVLGERMAIGDARARSYECVVMRLGHVYGPGEERYEKFVPTTIRALMKGRPATLVGDGSARRDLLYVDDAAEAVCRLALSPRGLPELVNVASASTYSLEQIAQTLVEVVGFLGRIRYLRDRPNPPSLGFDTRLLDEAIGRLDEVTLSEGLRREVEHVAAAAREASRAAGRV
jgi:UDP-glucose 4-epimerase